MLNDIEIDSLAVNVEFLRSELREQQLLIEALEELLLLCFMGSNINSDLFHDRLNSVIQMWKFRNRAGSGGYSMLEAFSEHIDDKRGIRNSTIGH